MNITNDGLIESNLHHRKIVVCGAGSAAHVFACLSGQNPLHEVHIFSLRKNKAERFKIALHDQSTNPSEKLVAKFIQEKRELYSTICNITKYPSKCLPNADLVIISLPAMAHELYLKAIALFVGDHKCTIAVFPGAGGLECDWKSMVLDKCQFSSNYILVSCNTLPWTCRVKQFGQCVHILGTKGGAEIAVHNHKNGNEKLDCIALLQSIIGKKPKLIDVGNLLNVSLKALNAIIHPAILYNKWHDWNGKPVAVEPLFYHGVSQAGADVICKMSEELQLIAECIEKETGMALNIIGGREYLMSCDYKGVNYSNIYSILRSNPAHDGLVHPMIDVSGANDYKSDESGKLYVPNFKYRYLTEDIPFGLCVIKGFSLLLKEIPITDNIDVVLRWAQKVMGKEYFIYEENSNKVIGLGGHIQETRAPQKYGYTNIEQFNFIYERSAHQSLVNKL